MLKHQSQHMTLGDARIDMGGCRKARQRIHYAKIRMDAALTKADVLVVVQDTSGSGAIDLNTPNAHRPDANLQAGAGQ